MFRLRSLPSLRHFYTLPALRQARPNVERDDYTLMHIDEHFRNVPKENRTKQTFLEAIAMYKKRSPGIRGHVEFINSCVVQMKDYGLHKDLDVYKAILDVFPVGPLLPQNVWQRMYLHYPGSQIACIKVLDEMEWNQVYPDREIHDKVARVFGEWQYATRKAKRMFFWLPKLRYTNKYLDRKLLQNRHAPVEFAELAKMALEMIARDKGTTVTYATAQQDRNLIVSAQSPLQRRLIHRMPVSSTSFFVDGPYNVYVAENRVSYIQLTTPPTKTLKQLADRWLDHADIEDVKKTQMYRGIYDLIDWQSDEVTMHEQVNETILALAVIENLDETSASAWISHLQRLCEPLRDATVVMRIRREPSTSSSSTSSSRTESDNAARENDETIAMG